VDLLHGCCKKCLLLLVGWNEVFALSELARHSLCCLSSCFSACWVGEVFKQYLISIRCVPRIYSRKSFGFLARGGGMDWQGHLLGKGNSLNCG
jgi:hypothetical protein